MHITQFSRENAQKFVHNIADRHPDVHKLDKKKCLDRKALIIDITYQGSFSAYTSINLELFQHRIFLNMKNYHILVQCSHSIIYIITHLSPKHEMNHMQLKSLGQILKRLSQRPYPLQEISLSVSIQTRTRALNISSPYDTS